MRKYLRHREDGFIYDWNPTLAKHPKLEEVTELQAYPERFKPEKPSKRPKENKQDPVDLSVPDVQLSDDAPIEFPELDAENTRRPFKRAGVVK
jgi:hypothetical protein